MQIISAFETIRWLFKNLHGISSFKSSINPPPHLLPSRLNNLYLFISNCILDKVESIFDSDIKNISKYVIVSAINSNFFLICFKFIVVAQTTNNQSIKIFKTLHFNFV